MNKKLVCTVFAALMTASIFTGCGSNKTEVSQSSAQNTKAEDYKGTVTIWDWDESFGKAIQPEFNKKYPNIKINYVIVNHDDYMQKLQSSLSAGSEVPDIILGEMAWRGKLFDLNILDELEAAPYNLDRTQMFDYVQPMLQNSKNKIVGVDQNMCPAGFAFRRDLAKQYLGTDDPEKLSEMLKDWDSFIAKGKEVVQKSDGKVKMMPGLGDALVALRGQNAATYINGTDIDITSRFKSTLENGLKLRDAGILGTYELYTPAWCASFAKGDTIFYNCAPWSPQWHVSANDKEGKGRWGLMKAPSGGFTLGGTSVSIYKKSENKAITWEYVKFAYFSKESGDLEYKNFGTFTGYKPYYDNSQNAIATQKGAFDDFFGGQNLADTFIKNIIPQVKAQPQTKYETIVDEAFNKLIPIYMQDKSIDSNKAMEKLIAEVKLKASDAKVK